MKKSGKLTLTTLNSFNIQHYKNYFFLLKRTPPSINETPVINEAITPAPSPVFGNFVIFELPLFEDPVFELLPFEVPPFEVPPFEVPPFEVESSLSELLLSSELSLSEVSSSVVISFTVTLNSAVLVTSFSVYVTVIVCSPTT
ncbi:hypothetical protein HMPREF0216_00366 [Clostridium celatum DSM 1785]|uniref:Uncharacterized protein n=1 Tax=Clostridium celatum DSM 1785 TaxID=545697 RepID=L1QN61_9CLOT|nr:hypothetical protein HMPREF0216_00366 [Clostridium celatum DSM 1785]